MCAGGRVSPAAAKPLRQWLQGQLRAHHSCPVLLTDAAASLLVTAAQTAGLTRAARLASALPHLPPTVGLDAASASASDTGLQARSTMLLAERALAGLRIGAPGEYMALLRCCRYARGSASPV